jgi:hypothetical protein
MESPACRQGRSWMDRQAIAFISFKLLAGAVMPTQDRNVTRW